MNRRVLARRCARGTLGGAGLAALLWWGLPWMAPLPERLLTPLEPSVVYVAADGSPLRQLLTEDGARVGSPVPRDELPPDLVHALLAAEDRRFFRHGGLDLLAICRAARDNLHQQRIVSGASTLTQQLVKISAHGSRRRSLRTKFIEALQARHLEMIWSKDRILTEYFHRVSFGNSLTGCASAVAGYLDKPMAQLTAAECAFLAALPQSPARLNPFRDPAAVEQRQRMILRRMHDFGWLTGEQFELARQQPLRLRRHAADFAAPHAVELALQHRGDTAATTLRTTIRPAIQQRVEKILRRHLDRLHGRHVSQAAAVVLENGSGHVIALAGSRDFFGRQDGQINGAWAPHSPGSALKPFVYALALERGFTAATIIPDLPVEYATATGVYRPENYDRRHHGPVTVREALGSSLNIPAVRVLQQIGGEKLLHHTLEELGIGTLSEDAAHYGLGLAIGNAPVRLLELANAYACLARNGLWLPWTLLRETTPPPAPRQLFQASTAWLVGDMLRDNRARLRTFGPDSVIRLPFSCAVKTGTSTNYRDNWALGFTREFTVAVWAGNFDNSPMGQVSGVTGAGPIFRDIFLHLHERYGTTWNANPAGVKAETIDPRTGHRLSPGEVIQGVSRQEFFAENTLPPLARASDYEPGSGRVLLGPEYAAWKRMADHWLSEAFTVLPDHDGAPPEVTFPITGSVFHLDPELPENGARLMLRSQGSGEWFSRTLELFVERGIPFARLRPGRHQLELRCHRSGRVARVEIEVREAASARPGKPAPGGVSGR